MPADEDPIAAIPVALAPRFAPGENRSVSLVDDAHCQVLECGWRVLPPRSPRRWWRLWRRPPSAIRQWQWRFVTQNPHEYPILFTVKFTLNSEERMALDYGRFGEIRYGDDLTGMLLLRSYEPYHSHQILAPGEAKVFSGTSEYEARTERDLGRPAEMVWICRTARLL